MSESVRTGYDQWSEIYDHDENPLQALEGPILHSTIGHVADCDMLDIGCGTGRHALWLTGQGARVTALDFSEGMLKQARLKPGADKVRFIVHDLHQPLPLADCSFGAVVSSLVLEHLSTLHSFFSEVARVLKPAGKAVLSTLHPAMFLRGTQARFVDPQSGEVIQPGSVPHSISDFIMAGRSAGLMLHSISEHSPDDELAARYPRAAKYVGWPMLVVFCFTK